MPTFTPGFPDGTLDENGTPVWLCALDAAEVDNHTVHVVRDLEPRVALQMLGAAPGSIRPCELPAERRDGWTSLPGTALGLAAGDAVLMAGRVGDWTFVYDDGGWTCSDSSLSGDGRTAATSTVTVDGDVTFIYAVDGTEIVNGDATDLVGPDADPAVLPARLRAAIHAAGIVDDAIVDDGEGDYDLGVRVVCALAGLRLTVDDLRRMPLLAAPLPEPDF